jgi:RNA polymerase sigma factor (sigma-70 family)
VQNRSRHFLREYVAARGRGDRQTMQHWWNLLLAEEWDRVQSSVRLVGGRVLWNEHELADGLTETAGRLAEKGPENFGGSSLDDWLAYVKGVARNSCLDVQRHIARRKEREGSSFDEMAEDDDRPKGWVEAAKARLEHDRLAAEEELADDDELYSFGREYLAWALPQLSKIRREVFVLLLAGKTPAEVMQELGVTRDVVDQNKRRAIQDLIKLKESYPS